VVVFAEGLILLVKALVSGLMITVEANKVLKFEDGVMS
jgi:hypothetical protein